jgi:hypothetical protein
MEEIQSTEIIDREILEDARKKAWRILKTADDTVKAQAAEWEKKTVERLDELRGKYLKRKEMAATEIISRLPMEKRRIKAQAIDSLLNQAVYAWYTGLDRGYVINLLKHELAQRCAACGEGFGCSGRVLYSKLSRSEADTICAESLAMNGANFSMEETTSGGRFPELIVDNDTVRISASVKKAVDFFLLEKRAELIMALVGTQVFDSEMPPTEAGAGEGQC